MVHSPQYGIEEIREGHFTDGIQDGFGRVHSMMKSCKDQGVSCQEDDREETGAYAEEQHYTGWWATSAAAGQGIAITDGETFQGEFAPVKGFPNGGLDWADPDLLAYQITSLENREASPEEREKAAASI